MRHEYCSTGRRTWNHFAKKKLGSFLTPRFHTKSSWQLAKKLDPKFKIVRFWSLAASMPSIKREVEAVCSIGKIMNNWAILNCLWAQPSSAWFQLLGFLVYMPAVYQQPPFQQTNHFIYIMFRLIFIYINIPPSGQTVFLPVSWVLLPCSSKV